MKKLLSAITFISIFFASTLASSMEIGGVNIPDQLQAGDQSLALNGAGIRSKFVFDLYVGGLYLTTKSSDAASIISDDSPMAIKLHIISSKITSDKMSNATREGFENATGKNTAPIQTEIDQFISAFSAEIVEGDIFDFVYTPGTGVEVSKNGASVTTVTSLAFKQALFGIWLSDKPAQKKLKDNMLGK